jgi:flavodoxin
MKGVICYYSSTGNTRLACRYIARSIQDVAFELFDVTKGKVVALERYDIVGFATFTDFLGPPQFFRAFIEGLARQSGVPAFVFNTYGNLSGRTLKVLDRMATAKGFQVIAGHSLHTPESYPPMIARGKGNEQAPDGREMAAFNGFVSDLSHLLGGLEAGEALKRRRIRVGLLNSVLPTFPRTAARKNMGRST